jgi:two-component system cell cycle response regulator DivK
MTNTPVLVVEDNEMNLRLVRYLLSANGYTVRTATNAAETMEALKQFHPRLILMDLQLPGTDGYELTRRLKAAPETRDIVIVALTAFAMKGDEEKAREAGCDAYITKPIDTRAFPAALEKILGG